MLSAGNLQASRKKLDKQYQDIKAFIGIYLLRVVTGSACVISRPLTSDSILMTTEVVLVITGKPGSFRLDAAFPATDQPFLCRTVCIPLFRID